MRKITYKINRKGERVYFAQCKTCLQFIRIFRTRNQWTGCHCDVQFDEITERDIERAIPADSRTAKKVAAGAA